MEFIRAVEKNPRVGTIHISLYAALLHLWLEQRRSEPVVVSARTVMPLAKIYSNNAYHRAIRELQDFGYIIYLPTHTTRGSQIYLKKIGKEDSNRAEGSQSWGKPTAAGDAG